MGQPLVAKASKITGWGHNLPQRVVDNEYFASYLETSDEWISSRTGIKQRHWSDKLESASSLAQPACEQALKSAGLSANDIDGIVLATVTPDKQFPSTACILQQRLGCPAGIAFDVNAVCSGFLYALSTADGLLRSKRARRILVVGVDLYSRIIDKNDRRTCILFGDGAGAVVLEACDDSEIGDEQAPGVLHLELGADGNHADILQVPLGTANEVTADSLAEGKHFLQMEGREVFRLAVRRLIEVSESVVDASGVQMADVDFVVSHQANKRILDAMAKHMGLASEKVLHNVERVGNTSAASIPILLSESLTDGKIKSGDMVLLSAFGGGVTWGAALVRI